MEREAAEREAAAAAGQQQSATASSAPPAIGPSSSLAAAAASEPQGTAEEREFQREYWDALKRTLMGTVNKTTRHNVRFVAVEALRENIIRGRGLLCRAIMRAQNHSPELTPVFAALVAVLNSKVPQTGELLVRRLVFQFKRCYKRQDVPAMSAAASFIAHLVLQGVQHELLLLKVLATMLCNGTPTADDVQVAAAVFRESFKYLEKANPAAFDFIMVPIRDLVGGGKLDLRSECTLERLLQLVRQWQDDRHHTDAIPAELDLVEPDDQHMHAIDLDDEISPEAALDTFNYDPDFDANEEAYDAMKAAFLTAEELEAPELVLPADEEEEDDGGAAADALAAQAAAAMGDESDGLTAQETSAQRRAIFLIVKSSIRADEVAHKLLKQVPQGRERIVVDMVFDAACRERSYDPLYGRIGALLCDSMGRYQHYFAARFQETWRGIDGLPSKSIGIIAKLYSQLLRGRSIHWSAVFEHMRLTEADTTPSSRMFIKQLLQDMGQNMGVAELKKAMEAPDEAMVVTGLFPRDTPESAKFAINFFEFISQTGVDLRPLAADLRRWYELGTAPNAAKRERSPEPL